MSMGEDSGFYEVAENSGFDDFGRKYYSRYTDDGGVETEFPAEPIEHIYEEIPAHLQEYLSAVIEVNDNGYENDQLTMIEFLVREYISQK